MTHIFSRFTLRDTQLMPHRIDIWQYPLHTEFTEARGLLSDEERTRADRFYFARHRRRFTVARAMLRLILGRYLAAEAASLNFAESYHGKPYIVNDLSLQFNLSHSKDLALVAIGQNYPLGIDLEFFSARPYLDLGRQMFSDNENNALQLLKPALQPLAFFNIWAQKEGLIKACGMGLSYPTETFDVPILSTYSTNIEDSLHQTMWTMVPFMPALQCCAALCHHPSIKEIRYYTLHDAQILL